MAEEPIIEAKIKLQQQLANRTDVLAVGVGPTVNPAVNESVVAVFHLNDQPPPPNIPGTVDGFSVEIIAVQAGGSRDQGCEGPDDGDPTKYKGGQLCRNSGTKIFMNNVMEEFPVLNKPLEGGIRIDQKKPSRSSPLVARQVDTGHGTLGCFVRTNAVADLRNESPRSPMRTSSPRQGRARLARSGGDRVNRRPSALLGATPTKRASVAFSW